MNHREQTAVMWQRRAALSFEIAAWWRDDALRVGVQHDNTAAYAQAMGTASRCYDLARWAMRPCPNTFEG